MSTTTTSREALTATRGRNYLPLQYSAAVLLAAMTLLYSAAWMYYVRRPLQATQVEIGIDAFYSSAGVEIDDVHPNSPAEKAGLKTKDLIVAINGSSAFSASAWNGLENRTWLRSQPGDTVTLTVRRPGQSQPLVLTPWFRAKQGAGDTKSLARSIYAVVKHRVMDVPVLLKRSARYFVVERGFVFLILAVSVGLTFWFGQAFSRHFSAGSRAAIPVGAAFGVLLITGATQVHRRVRTRLDRAFFRSSYDAQQILENLAAKTLNVSSREGLAELLQQNIGDALHPRSMFVYLEASNGQLVAYAGNPPPEAMTLSNSSPEIADLAERGGPLELMPEEMYGTQLAPLDPECLVPICGSSNGQLQGLAVLGPRLSEESYSAMDKRLLASVASQAGIAMRSIALAEKMAQTMEAERRSEQEMQIARQVQSRLLPQQAPSLKTLDCAGKCIQTRAVGGDYYDFLDFGSGRLGLVVADISGKGMSAALLMANLQANLRGQYALALEDVPHLLRSVNRLFYKNTETSNYATMFFAVYDDEIRRLRYVNCGHNPPVLMRANGNVERLGATATVLGLFEEWDCEVVDCKLAPGDVLVIYTDGISEAGESEDGDSEEFGEERLIAAIRKQQWQSAAEILDGILREVQQFSRGEQADDMTLIVARGR